MFRRFRSLRKKLICSVLLTLSIPIIIVVVIAQVRSQSAIRAQAKKLNENLLEMGIHQMDATWEGLDDVHRSIYLNEAFREYLLHYGQQTGPNAAASESDLLKRVFLSSLSSRADLYSIIFVDNSGRLTYATREESGSVPEYADAALPDAYLTCLEPDQMNRLDRVLLPTCVHMPLHKVRNGAGEYVYAVARQIVNTEQHFEQIGTMFITVNLTGMKQLASLILSDQQAYVYICDRAGRVYFDSSGQLTARTLPEEMMVFKDGLSEHEIRLDGQAHMALSVQSQKTDWVLMTAIPETLYSSDATAVSKSILTALVLALTLMTVVTAFFATRISRPIETLADTMEHMNLRKLEHRVAVVGNDEIARLSISFNTLMDNLSTSIQNEYEMELLQKRSEICVLQAQMNPHFLYNVLQSISSLAMLDKVSEIITVSNSLGNTLRYCINSSQPLAPLRDEIAHVTNYLTIQTIRFGDRLRYELSIPAYTRDYLLPRMSLQPMVENAILHGFGERQELGTILIQSWADDSFLTVEITDDGAGIAPERLDALRKRLCGTAAADTEHGVGLVNLKARLALLYEKNGRLEIDSEAGIGTTIRIIVPVGGEQV